MKLRSSYRLALGLITLVITSASSHALEDCNFQKAMQEMFPIEVQSGKVVSDQRIFAQLPYPKSEYKVEALGHGAGGEAIKMTEKKNPLHSIVVKLTDLDSAVNDHIAFDLIKTAAGPESPVQIISHKMHPVKEVASNTMLIPATTESEYVGGRSLFSVLADPSAPKEVKERLTNQYNQFLQMTSDGLEAQYGIKMMRRPAIKDFFPAERKLSEGALKAQPNMAMGEISLNKLIQSQKGNTPLYRKMSELLKHHSRGWISGETDIQMIVKSDNIFVTPGYKLYLIDPH